MAYQNSCKDPKKVKLNKIIFLLIQWALPVLKNLKDWKYLIDAKSYENYGNYWIWIKVG
jgi:hypothetical protein